MDEADLKVYVELIRQATYDAPMAHSYTEWERRIIGILEKMLLIEFDHL